MSRRIHIYPDGAKYEGAWIDNKRHGNGVWTRPDGFKYAGEWENDKPNGQGSLTFPGGKKYIGEWKDGKMHGQGIEIHPDGAKIYGEWENGELVEERLPEPDQINQELGTSNREHKVKTRAQLLITPKAKQYRNKPIIWLVSVVVVLLLAALFTLKSVGEETYSISGRVVNYPGEGIDGVIIDFGEEFEATKTDENGYWSKSDLRGEITVTPQYGQVVFYPIRSEVSKPNDEVSFTLLKEMGEGITSSSGEYVFSSNLTEEEVEITVLVEDFKTGEQLEGITVEVVVSGDTIEILLQDNKGEYLPEIIVLEMEHLENYPGVEVRKGSLLISVKTVLLAKPHLEWAIENPREASAVAALGVAAALDVYGLVSYTAGGIAIATGAGALPGVSAIATGFATSLASGFLRIYAASVFADKEKTDHSITIYIFESRKSAQHTKLLVPAGKTTDEIVEAIEFVVGNREFEIEIPEKNPAGAYYNDDGTPKFFYLYLKESQRELVAEPEPEYIVLVDVDVLRLRSGPGTDHDILGRLVLGTALRVVGQQNKWLQVVTPEEKNGWIHSDYVISQKDDEKRSIINRSKEPYMCFFNGGYEFGLEPIGLSAGMSIEKVIGILGEPLAREKNEEGLRGPTTELVYDGLMLGFYNSPELNDSSLGYYRIFSPEFIGKRGICVGDTAESVMSKYLKDYEKESDECIEIYKCVELYYLEADDGSVQSGMYHRDQNTGEIISISYWHGVPQSCAGSSIKYTIENGLVKAIQLY